MITGVITGLVIALVFVATIVITIAVGYVLDEHSNTIASLGGLHYLWTVPAMVPVLIYREWSQSIRWTCGDDE